MWTETELTQQVLVYCLFKIIVMCIVTPYTLVNKHDISEERTTLQMVAVISVIIYQPARHHIPEGSPFQLVVK
jgi:hypothetical protein